MRTGYSYNLRFPGQYFDAETGKHYNYYRDFDASIGRYLQSDPVSVGEHVARNLFRSALRTDLGLYNEGASDLYPLELNSYLYAAGSPLRWIDPDGQSSLAFDGGAGSLCAYDAGGTQLFCCNAGNNVTKNSKGPFPNGNFTFSHYNRHPQSGPTGPFGSHGIFVFDLSGHGRSGMGVHSGRSGPSSPTDGCIRTTDPCMKDLKSLHRRDPITDLTVK